MAHPPFFTKHDFNSFAKLADVAYDKNNPSHVEASKQLKAGVWAKTGYWASEIQKRLPNYEASIKMTWHQRNNAAGQKGIKFRPYTWARITVRDAAIRDVYFTVGLNPIDRILILKLDFQREGTTMLSNTQRSICYQHLYLPDKSRRYSNPVPESALSSYDWDRLVAEAVAFIQSHEQEYLDLLKLLSITNERRIARVAWNTKGWMRPSGERGKSKDKDSHEYQQGFGHEEWLFDVSKLIEGHHYAFLEPVRSQHAAFDGRTFDVMLYSIDGETGGRYWVGEINNMEVISHDQAVKVVNVYKSNGWYNEMQNQIKPIEKQPKSLSKWNNIDLFNIRFKPESLTVYPDLIEISENDNSIKSERYIFLKGDEDFSQPAEVKGFAFVPPDAKANGSGNGYSTWYTRQAKSIEIELFHKKISDQLCKLLRQKYGKGNVHPEHPSGIGSNRIDIVVKEGSECIFYEIKTHNALRVCIREGFGQIMEYSYYADSNNAKELIIVSHHAADANVATYLQHLRARFDIPLYYQHFDLESNILSNKI
ncbi:hypothetical protein H8S95_09685 [Pontibacter sp. KCTC 32443]|uniref:hypothetical protein n=1 Tax=Pontibacter TaxID=323449 RepID=UPI00164D5082|nr:MULTISPECIES: hypothetical protein [Pontibacter]MBC5774330.1 hypothetical protein [Pontibacter sp. KCTC 32443]